MSGPGEEEKRPDWQQPQWQQPQQPSEQPQWQQPQQQWGQQPPQQQWGGQQQWQPQPATPGSATAALILGICGLLVCGVILGPLAIVYGNKARRQIDSSGGRLGGRGMATAGLVLGWVALGLWAIWIIIVIISAASS
ncbi:MAG TPA: DUF4190 domain-containing protein [Solirubrobacter sp.]|nr:DUF4190 domain-containing protein [Solirubrobacter sp.]